MPCGTPRRRQRARHASGKRRFARSRPMMLASSIGCPLPSWDAQTSPPWHIAMPSGGGIHSIDQTLLPKTGASAAPVDVGDMIYHHRCVSGCARTDEASWMQVVVVAIKQSVDDGFAEQVGFIADLVRFPSQRGEERAAQDYMARAYAAEGYRSTCGRSTSTRSAGCRVSRRRGLLRRRL